MRAAVTAGGNRAVRPIVARAVTGVLVLFTDEDHDVVACDDRLVRLRPGLDAWPADGQLALHLLAWLRGPGFRDPALDAALSRLDFGAASEAAMSLSNGGHCGVIALHSRAAHSLRNADRVLRLRLNPEVLLP